VNVGNDRERARVQHADHRVVAGVDHDRDAITARRRDDRGDLGGRGRVLVVGRDRGERLAIERDDDVILGAVVGRDEDPARAVGGIRAAGHHRGGAVAR